jgi:tripartite-type tricarboxylate transporter receptor subunit TctC
MHRRRRSPPPFAGTAAIPLAAPRAQAPWAPERPVRLSFGCAAGGGTDVAARRPVHGASTMGAPR